MKSLAVVLFSVLLVSSALSEKVLLQKASGDVYVRHGVAEAWTRVAVGDVLKPDDSMKTGKKGSAVLIVDGAKRMMIPPDVIVDVSDIRTLTQDELMLKLTMERIRSSSHQWKDDEMNTPNAAVVHGAQPVTAGLTENDLTIGKLEWNGAKLLFEYGYFSTSALKAMDILRRYPPLASAFENLMLVARALDRADLRGEALHEYAAIAKRDDLAPDQRRDVQASIDRLRKQARE
jgi:hypothetical protein